MSWYLFLATFRGQNIIWIFSNIRVSTFFKNGLSESITFSQNWGILQTRMDQEADHMKMNFGYFQIQNWMSYSGKNRWKIELWSLNCPKKCIFWNFVLTSAGNLSLLRQFTYKQLKLLITLFQKMVWFIGVWNTICKILAIKISKKMLNQQRFNKIFPLQTLISPKQ